MDPAIAGIRNQIDQAIFDMGEWQNGSTQVDFIAIPRGQLFPLSAVQKTLRHTNVQTARQLPGSQALKITAIGLSIVHPFNVVGGDDMADVWDGIFAEGMLRIEVDDKPFLDIPAMRVAAAGGPHLVAAGAAAVTQMVQNGPVSPRANFTLENPIIIEQGQYFTATLYTDPLPTYPSGGAPVGVHRVRLDLDGILDRPVN